MPAHFLDWSSRDQKDAPWWPRYCPDPKQPCPMQTMRWDAWQMGRQCTIWWWWWCWWVFPSLVKKFSIVELGSQDLFRKGEFSKVATYCIFFSFNCLIGSRATCNNGHIWLETSFTWSYLGGLKPSCSTIGFRMIGQPFRRLTKLIASFILRS